MYDMYYVIEHLVDTKRSITTGTDRTMLKITDFCRYLAGFEYICVDSNGKILPATKRNFDKHVTLPATTFTKCGGGVCYDYANYEASRFSSFGVKYKVFFNGYYADGIAEFTHTYLLFYINDLVYWFECSWKTHMGIFQFASEDDAISYILQLHKGDVDTSVVQYTPNNSLVGISVGDFINKMSRLPEYNFKYKVCPKVKRIYKVSSK